MNREFSTQEIKKLADYLNDWHMQEYKDHYQLTYVNHSHNKFAYKVKQFDFCLHHGLFHSWYDYPYSPDFLRPHDTEEKFEEFMGGAGMIIIGGGNETNVKTPTVDWCGLKEFYGTREFLTTFIDKVATVLKAYNETHGTDFDYIITKGRYESCGLGMGKQLHTEKEIIEGIKNYSINMYIYSAGYKYLIDSFNASVKKYEEEQGRNEEEEQLLRRLEYIDKYIRPGMLKYDWVELKSDKPEFPIFERNGVTVQYDSHSLVVISEIPTDLSELNLKPTIDESELEAMANQVLDKLESKGWNYFDSIVEPITAELKSRNCNCADAQYIDRILDKSDLFKQKRVASSFVNWIKDIGED